MRHCSPDAVRNPKTLTGTSRERKRGRDRAREKRREREREREQVREGRVPFEIVLLQRH